MLTTVAYRVLDSSIWFWDICREKKQTRTLDDNLWTSLGPFCKILIVCSLQKYKNGYGGKFSNLIRHLSWENCKKTPNRSSTLVQKIRLFYNPFFFNFLLLWVSLSQSEPVIISRRLTWLQDQILYIVSTYILRYLRKSPDLKN